MKLRSLFLVLTLVGVVGASPAHALKSTEVEGRWKGKLTKTVDTCGFSDTSINIRHDIFTGYGTVLALFLTDQNGRKSWALSPYVGSAKDGGYFRAIPGGYANLGDGWRTIYAYTYTKIKKGIAKVDYHIQYQKGTTNVGCDVVFKGVARRR